MKGYAETYNYSWKVGGGTGKVAGDTGKIGGETDKVGGGTGKDQRKKMLDIPVIDIMAWRNMRMESLLAPHRAASSLCMNLMTYIIQHALE